jgi:hypothetical protein
MLVIEVEVKFRTETVKRAIFLTRIVDCVLFCPGVLSTHIHVCDVYIIGYFDS